MSLFNFLVLPVFVALLLTVIPTGSVLLNALLTNIFGYIWIYLIWNAERRQLPYCFLYFLLIVGPFSYIGYSEVRDTLVRLGYGCLKVHLFQPLIALTIPTTSFALRFWKTTPALDVRKFFVRSTAEVLVGLPVWAVIVSLFPRF